MVLWAIAKNLVRDPNEIEVSVMYRDIAHDASVDDDVRGAEQLAQLGVSALVTSTVGTDSAGGWRVRSGGRQNESPRSSLHTDGC